MAETAAANLAVVVKEDLSVGPMVAYPTVCRFLKDHGLVRQKARPRERDKGVETAVVPLETRSFEVAHVNALWHFDFHEGKRNVLTVQGEPKKPYLLGILDDCSRLCCHARWYEQRDNTEDLVHGFSQAIQKRKLPRATLSDNGSPMIAAESRDAALTTGARTWTVT
jgi:transposase InsO family protein